MKTRAMGDAQVVHRACTTCAPICVIYSKMVWLTQRAVEFVKEGLMAAVRDGAGLDRLWSNGWFLRIATLAGLKYQTVDAAVSLNAAEKALLLLAKRGTIIPSAPTQLRTLELSDNSPISCAKVVN